MQGLDLLHGTGIVAAGVAADMGHQHPHAFALEREEGRVNPPGHAAVDIPAYGAQGFEGGDAVGQFERADVSGVPDFVDLFEEFAEPLVEASVRVGDDAYFFHDFCVVCCRMAAACCFRPFLPFRSSVVFAVPGLFCRSGSLSFLPLPTFPTFPTFPAPPGLLLYLYLSFQRRAMRSAILASAAFCVSGS